MMARTMSRLVSLAYIGNIHIVMPPIQRAVEVDIASLSLPSFQRPNTYISRDVLIIKKPLKLALPACGCHKPNFLCAQRREQKIFIFCALVTTRNGDHDNILTTTRITTRQVSLLQSCCLFISADSLTLDFAFYFKFGNKRINWYGKSDHAGLSQFAKPYAHSVICLWLSVNHKVAARLKNGKSSCINWFLTYRNSIF